MSSRIYNGARIAAMIMGGLSFCILYTIGAAINMAGEAVCAIGNAVKEAANCIYDEMDRKEER